MAYRVTDQGGEDFSPAPVGTHLACCCSVIYAGFQKSQFGTKPKLILTFELSQELNDAGEPYTVNAFYTASLHPKAKLRAALEAWRAKPFTKDELSGFEVTKLLGAPCMVTIAHKANAQTQKTNAVVAGVTSLPRGTGKPQMKAKPLYYSVDDPDESCPKASLPEWIQKICAAAVSQGDDGIMHVEPPEPASDPNEEIPF
jgi:hypothetical protein